jgi:uncharacterized protein YjbJ (UPF0337 family)
MPSDKNPDIDDERAETASRSGYDSASEMARGKVKEAAGTLAGDENLRDEGETQQYLADAEEKEDLKAWQREDDQP